MIEHRHGPEHDSRCQCTSVEELLASVRGIIDEHGWAIQGVIPEEGHDWFFYTVGLTERGLPEIMLTGVDVPEVAQGFLNTVARTMVEAPSIFTMGYQVGSIKSDLPPELGAPAPVYLIRVPTDIQGHKPGVAKALYGEHVRVMALVLPDDDGRYAWDYADVTVEQFVDDLWNEETERFIQNELEGTS